MLRRQTEPETVTTLPGDPMIAMLRASARVRDGRWINGAPTHVLAEFLNVLESEGWRLVRVPSDSARCVLASRP